MASAVRHLRCLAHTWPHFALCPSGHWPRSAPEIRFAAIRNRRNPDTCDLSLPTPTSISHPPSRQNAASPKHPAFLDARANRSGARSCLSRACIRDFTHPWQRPILSLACSHARLHASLQRPRVSRILAFSIAVFLATPKPVSRPRASDGTLPRSLDPVSRTPAPSIAPSRAAPSLCLALPRTSIAHFLAEPFQIRTPNRVRLTRANINYSFAELLLLWRRWCDRGRHGTTSPGQFSRRDGDRG